MKIVIISNNDWDGLWYQRQQFASMYASMGHEVLFINKTLQRFPRFKDFKDRFTNRDKNSNIKRNPVPANVLIKTIYVLPPLKCLRFVNKLILKLVLPSLFKKCDLLLTYVPTFTALDIIKILSPKKTAYINVHNYDADQVVADLLKSEKILSKSVDFLFADSKFNIDRMVRVSGGRKVYDSEPGVDSKKFLDAYRGDESEVKNVIGYFGGIGEHMDIDFYNKLATKFKVVFIGSLNNESVREKISNEIIIRPPVTNNELPNALKEIDILAILYHRTDYVSGVIPAKTFECLATLKPVVVSGLGNVDLLKNVLYTCDGTYRSFLDIINNKLVDHHSRIDESRDIAKKSDWSYRFKLLNNRLGINV